MQNMNLSKWEAIIVIPASKTNSPFDPLKFEIFGLTVIERCFRSFEKAGCEHITIVVEKEADLLKQLLASTKPWRLSFSIVDQNSVQSVINSYKLLPPEKGLIVLTESLILDPLLIEKRMQKSERRPCKISISKNQKMLFFTPRNIQMLSSSIFKSGGNTFSQKNTFKSFSSALLCQTVHSSSDVQLIEKSLIRNLTKPNDGWVSRNLNRPISTLFSRLLASTHITPNQVTLALVIPSLLTGYVFAQGGYWGFLIGGALFHLTSILDGVDGELARLKFKSSLYGKWLDFMCDNLAYLAALVGFLVGLFRDGISPFEKTASLTALALTLCMMGSIILYYKKFNKDGKLLTVEYGFREGKSWLDKMMQTAELLGKREWFALIFLALAIIGKMEWVLVYVSVVAAGVLVFSFEAHARAARMNY